MTGRRRLRRTQLFYELKEKRGYRKIREKALDRAAWREFALKEAMNLS